MSNTALNRTIVAILTNKSGGDLNYGDVVVLDSTTASSFTTTTTQGLATDLIGVIVEPNGIANNASGLVATGGYIPQINLDGAATLGDYLLTDTVAGQGTPSSSLAVGAFGQTLEASATPQALLWGGLPAQNAASGATTELDNLGTVAVNTDIISDTDSTDSLGSTDVKWLKGFFDTLSLGEVAAAPADVAGDGQIWVKNDTPNTLWFTDDAGTDTQLGVGGSSLTNSNITPTTGNVSAAVNYRYFADISGLTADRNFVLPSCSAGDEIQLKLTVGDATYELVIIGDTGVSIEGGTAATEWKKAKRTGEAFRFVADGTDSWMPMGIIPRGVELDYVEFTSNVTPTATSEATADTIVTGSSVDYDGSTIILVEFWSNNARPDAGTNNRNVTFWLYEDSSSIGQIGFMSATSDTPGINSPVHCVRRITPSSGSHTYSIRASVNAGTALVAAGAGGSGNPSPGFIRIVRANP